jgi:hypothetical protein
MKRRATKTTDPLDGPVDFTRFGPVRRRAFAGAGERGGPSLLALWEMPELASGAVLLRRGRPAKGGRRGGGKRDTTRHKTRHTTIVRSVRLPAELWEEIEERARTKHLNLHQAMRAALVGWARRAR